MKELGKIAGIFALLTLCIPMIGFLSPGGEKTQEIPDVPEAGIIEERYASYAGDMPFFVLDVSSGEVTEMTVYDYVKGAVFAEMPAQYHPEALKAQAVAAHTYAARRMAQQRSSPDPELKGAYISTDSSRYQAFFTPEQAKSFYGGGYEEYERKISEAVNSVTDEIIVYDGEPVSAAFHAISSGVTESAEVVWGSALPYLVPVSSPADINSPAYSEERSFTPAELEARLYASFGAEMPEDKEKWLTIEQTSSSGTVTALSAGNVKLTGQELRAALSLRSACFDVRYDEPSDRFLFTVRGSGHGAGMSQYGANAMAEQGSTYKEILLHYYTGAEIAQIKS